MSEAATCPRCDGTGIVSVQHGSIYMTDSEEEILLAFHEEACPVCRPNLVREGGAMRSEDRILTRLDTA